MAIRREETQPENDYTIIPNSWLRDTSLSLKARGLLSLLMSHRVGWNVTIESLARENPEGKAAIRSAVGELESQGYLRREQVHNHGGQFSGFDYVLEYSPSCDNRTPPFDKPTTDKPTTDKPTTDNRTHKKTIDKKTIYKKTNSQESATSALAETTPKPLHQEITAWVYDQTQGSINFAAVMAVVKHHLNHDREPKEVANGCMALYKMGKPITNQTLGQYLDGHLSKPAFRKTQQERQADQLEVINNLAQQYPLGENTEYEPY